MICMGKEAAGRGEGRPVCVRTVGEVKGDALGVLSAHFRIWLEGLLY